MEITSWDALKGSKFLVFLLKEYIQSNPEGEENAALILSEKLSGHPLALAKVAALIDRGQFSIREFVAVYSGNVGRLHSIGSFSAFWDTYFEQLDDDSRSLLGAMSFLMPDVVPQDLFIKSVNKESAKHLGYCSDKQRYVAVLISYESILLTSNEIDYQMF